jgi:hypothetical protein
MLGLDPLYIANEGKLVAMVAPEAADAVLAAMRAHPLGQRAAQIGLVTRRSPPVCANDHPFWRSTGGGLAQWRAPATHLLTKAWNRGRMPA